MLKIKQDLLEIIDRIDSLMVTEKIYEGEPKKYEENTDDTKADGVVKKSTRTAKQIEAYQKNFQRRWVGKDSKTESSVYDDIW